MDVKKYEVVIIISLTLKTKIHSLFLFASQFFQTLFEDERHALNQKPIFEFVNCFVERAPNRCLRRDATPLLNGIAVSVDAALNAMVTAPNLERLFVIAKKINGDLRALLILFST